MKSSALQYDATRAKYYYYNKYFETAAPKLSLWLHRRALPLRAAAISSAQSLAYVSVRQELLFAGRAGWAVRHYLGSALSRPVGRRRNSSLETSYDADKVGSKTKITRLEGIDNTYVSA